MSLKRILSQNKNNVALVIGNGLNRYGNAKTTNSWDDLLLKLANQFNILDGENIPDGISLTEFYDLLDLQKPITNPAKIYLQKEFCAGMDEWCNPPIFKCTRE